MHRPRVLLTGATGYIGAQLARRLIIDGYPLAILVRPSSNLDVLQEILPSIQVHTFDGSYSSLVAILELFRPELVIHVASLFISQHKSEDVFHLIESNILFPTQLLEAMSQLGIVKLINTGTSWQHYKNMDYSPVNLYAATKQAFETLLDYYVEAKGFKVITLKLFDTYGPGDTRPKLFCTLRMAARSGKVLKMSPGEQLLDIVFIDDVVNAYLFAMARVTGVAKSECFAVSSMRSLSLKEVVKTYSEITGVKVNVEWGGLAYRPREVLTLWSNTALLPGWQPRVTIEEGILRMERDSKISGLLS